MHCDGTIAVDPVYDEDVPVAEQLFSPPRRMSKHYPQGYPIVIFVTLFCACLLAIEGWRNWEVRVDELREMADRGEEIAKLAAQQADGVFSQAQIVLAWVGDAVADPPASGSRGLRTAISSIKQRDP